MLSYLLVMKICLLISISMEWCSQVVFPSVLSGELITICVGFQMKMTSLYSYLCISRCICILGMQPLFLFLNNRQGVGVILIGHITFGSDCFQKECQSIMQLQKHCNLLFQLVFDMLIVGIVEPVWREKLSYLLQSLNSCINV